MAWSIRLLRVRNIEIKVHLTFLLILVWAAFAWSSESNAGWRGALFGVVAVLLLFVCVTLHELGHSLQAVAYGVRVREILLLPIGGVSEIEDMPKNPGQEFRITLAGPVVSFGLAVVFYLVALLIQRQPVVNPDLLAATASVSWLDLPAYLSMANLWLGIFNLIPAFPMDGGRMLRSFLAMHLSYQKATRLAVSIGQGLALVFGLWGVASGNLLLVLIAIFVWIGAEQEGGAVTVRNRLRTVTVGQAMTREPRVLYPQSPLSDAVALTLSTLQSEFPVVDGPGGRRVTGLLTREDLVEGLRRRGGDSPVGEVMHTRLPTVTVADLILDARGRMVEAKLSSVPVVDPDGDLVGLLTIGDVSEALLLAAAIEQFAGRP